MKTGLDYVDRYPVKEIERYPKKKISYYKSAGPGIDCDISYLVLPYHVPARDLKAYCLLDCLHLLHLSEVDAFEQGDRLSLLSVRKAVLVWATRRRVIEFPCRLYGKYLALIRRVCSGSKGC